MMKLNACIHHARAIASLPDAYVITLSKPYQWFVVENELSAHPVYSHIVPQLMKFINGIKNSMHACMTCIEPPEEN